MHRNSTNTFVRGLVPALVLSLLVFTGQASAQLLNEIVVNPNGGDDNCEYVEILGTPNAALTDLYFASVEGDSGSNEGTFDFVVDLSAQSLGSNGLLVITAMDTLGDCGSRTYNSPPTTLVRDSDLDGGRLENGTNSWLLIRSPTSAIVEGTDYDTDDNGSLELLPADAVIIDSIGWTDGGVGDIIYGGVELGATAGGTPDMATRFPDNMTASSAAAWYWGDMDGATDSLNYDLTQVSPNFPAGGRLTPGDLNVGAPRTASVDFDGDGVTDYSIVRNTTPGLRDGGSTYNGRTLSLNDRMTAGKNEGRKKQARTDDLQGGSPGTGMGWWIWNSDTGSPLFVDFGDFFDFWVPADYDGDGRSDIAVWREISTGQPSGNAFFFILQSSDSTVVKVDFGQNGDNPTVTGDYDGDGEADPAVYRCPPNMLVGGGQCTFYYKGSSGGGEITYINWGNNSPSSVRPYPGDFDGDGQYDFVVFQDGIYYLLRSSDFGVEYIYWGLQTDVLIVPGDYDGDGLTDFMNARVNGSTVEWYLLERDGGGTGASPIQWGAIIAGYTEFATPGDFDGDGSTDIGVWRRSDTNPDDNYYYIRRSSDMMLETFEWGSPGDFPVPGWNAQ